MSHDFSQGFAFGIDMETSMSRSIPHLTRPSRTQPSACHRRHTRGVPPRSGGDAGEKVTGQVRISTVPQLPRVRTPSVRTKTSMPSVDFAPFRARKSWRKTPASDGPDFGEQITSTEPQSIGYLENASSTMLASLYWPNESKPASTAALPDMSETGAHLSETSTKRSFNSVFLQGVSRSFDRLLMAKAYRF